MSFNGAAFLKDKVSMAKWEIHRRFGTVKALWWKFMPGVKITVKWPAGLVEIDDSMPQWDWTIGPAKYVVASADPNDHYRPWLEQNVGRQGWDWDWRLGPITGAQGSANGPTYLTGDYLEIKFRKAKAEYATMFKLIWPD
jgi:hypothetical protein